MEDSKFICQFARADKWIIEGGRVYILEGAIEDCEYNIIHPMKSIDGIHAAGQPTNAVRHVMVEECTGGMWNRMTLAMVEIVELLVNLLMSLCLKIRWNISSSSVNIIARSSLSDLVGWVAFMSSTKPMNLIIPLILKFNPLPVGRLPTIDRHMALIWGANH